ncbi:diacylglycerol kinase [Marinicella sp. S1101]|uniref:diacylglycerol kinase n=1 Tax=Marinicella marina TaxID=2996016 RepID=UPI002260E0DA|nr:diacylglycerol kinase [Marinicella marina]MCX7553225.1 diacylglycerol kinase [Marinicella marina]MDJ1138957.1 diacylglycerol kinase [Marinicella marina]
MPDSGFRGPKQIYQAMKWSFKGLRATYVAEASFRMEIYLCLVLIPLAIWLAQTPIELILLVGSCLLVLLVEIINSAIEAIVDLVCGEEHHELAGRAKDMGSAAVFMAQMLVLLTWLVIGYQNLSV